MAHDEKCIGTWENSTIGGKDDGRIRIDDHSTNVITGWHFKSSSRIDGTCTGSVQHFSRVIPNSDPPKKVKYKDGKITKSGTDYKINGTSEDESASPPGLLTADKKRNPKAGKKTAPPPEEPWEAEKTGA